MASKLARTGLIVKRAGASRQAEHITRVVFDYYEHRVPDNTADRTYKVLVGT